MIRERLIVTRPSPETKANLQQLHGVMVAVGFDRRLSEALRDTELKVRRDLDDQRRRSGGIIRGRARIDASMKKSVLP